MTRATVAALLVGALAACALRGPGAPAPEPSLLIVGARLWGVPGQDALLVEDGRIRAVGASADLRAAAPGARVLDAERGWLLPGFHDAHVHLLSAGLALGALPLAEHTSLEGLLEALEAYAGAHPEQAWLTGHGWSYDLWPAGALPTRESLDAVVPDRPVWLESYDGHAGWANSRALERAGIGPSTPDPPDGRIAREADGVTPQGALLEGAMALVERARPQPGRAQKLAALERALRHCASLGITSLDDFATDPGIFELYAELARAGRLPLRVAVSLPLDGDLEQYAALRERYRENPRFGYLKGFVDGVVESRTAYLLEPYSGSADARGEPLIPPERLLGMVRAAHARGFPVALHAIGDAAVRLALDTYERSGRPVPSAAPPDRIEHIEVIAPADLPRFRALGVVASMQPFHANPFGDHPEAGVWSRNLGSQRLRHSFAWRELAGAGAVLAFGSDWPVMTADPLQGVAVAVTRQDAHGRPAVGWQPEQTLELEEALAAYAEGRVLAPGQPADLVVLAPGTELRRVSTLWHGERVRAVIAGGRIVAPAAAVAPARRAP